MKTLTTIAYAAVTLLAAVAPAAADVRVTMRDGLVTIVAKDVTVRQILAEWARVGRASIVNADRIAGGPVTLELADVPEKQALDILLRSVSGYLAVPRAAAVSNASYFDRILLLPTAAQPRASSSGAAAAPLPQPAPRQQFQLQPVTPEFSEVPMQNAPGANPIDPAQRQPAVNQAAPGAQPAPTFAAPKAPIGTATPGVILPPPPQPGQPGRF